MSKREIFDKMKSLGPGVHKTELNKADAKAVAYEYCKQRAGGEYPAGTAPIKVKTPEAVKGTPPEGCVIVIEPHEWYEPRFMERKHTEAIAECLELQPGAVKEYDEAEGLLSSLRNALYAEEGASYSVTVKDGTITVKRREAKVYKSTRSRIMDEVERVGLTGEARRLDAEEYGIEYVRRVAYGGDYKVSVAAAGGSIEISPPGAKVSKKERIMNAGRAAGRGRRAVITDDDISASYTRTIIYNEFNGLSVSVTGEGIVVENSNCRVNVKNEVRGLFSEAMKTGAARGVIPGGASKEYIKNIASELNTEFGAAVTTRVSVNDKGGTVIEMSYKEAAGSIKPLIEKVSRSFPALAGAIIQTKDLFDDNHVLTDEGLEELKDYLIRAQNEVSEEIYYLTEQNEG